MARDESLTRTDNENKEKTKMVRENKTEDRVQNDCQETEEGPKLIPSDSSDSTEQDENEPTFVNNWCIQTALMNWIQKNKS